MAKNIIPALNRAKRRIERALETDQFRFSRGSKIELANALADIGDVIEAEEARLHIPGGLVRLSVNVNAATADALMGCRNRQKGTNGSAITMTETVRRAISIYKYVLDEVEAGRMVVTMDGDGTHKKELVFG